MKGPICSPEQTPLVEAECPMCRVKVRRKKVTISVALALATKLPLVLSS